MFRILHALDMTARYAVWALIRVYQLTLSFWLGGRCRFTPTCSHYAQEAVLRHGLIKGAQLAINRILRCGPGGGHGFDPVPPIGYENPCNCACHHEKRKTTSHGR